VRISKPQNSRNNSYLKNNQKLTKSTTKLQHTITTKVYFGLAYKLSSKKKFELEATTKILRDVYDDIVMKSMLDTLSEDLNNLNWSTQETEIRKLTGLKASYLGSKNGCTLKQLTCSVF